MSEYLFCYIIKAARGDYRRTSDIDLAVIGGDVVRFAVDVEEETSTLLKFDVVDMNSSVQPELKKSIEQEGKVLYEKNMITFVLHWRI